MAAPAYATVSNGVYGASSPITVPNLTATVGDLVVLQVMRSSGSDLTTWSLDATSAGIADLAGTADAMTNAGAGLNSFPLGGASGGQHIYLGRATGTTVSIVITRESGTGGWYCRAYSFSNVNAGTTLATVIENGTAGTAANGASAGSVAQIDDTGVTTLGVDRLAVQFVGVADDNAVGAFTGMTGGTWAEAVAEYTNTTGNPDGCIQLQTATMASAATINGGSYTMGAADPWGVAGFALIGTTLATRQPRYGFVHFNDPGIL